MMNKHLIQIIVIFLFTFPLFSQRGDFYDTYDYDMKNYRGGDAVGNEKYKEYELPPKNKKPALVNPKNVQRQPEYSSLLQGQVGIRKSNNQSQNPAEANAQNLPFNPITGQLNPDALLKQREKEKLAKEKKREFLNREIEPYTETRARRMEIIFLTTFPFAVGISVGLTILAGNITGQENFIKSTPGFAFGFLCASGLSAANMISDINQYDDYMKNKRDIHTVNFPIYNQGIIQQNSKSYSFTFTLGSKNF